MRGLPKFFNTKQDYLNCFEGYKEGVKAELQKLLDARFNWFDVEVLENPEIGINDETHRVIENMQQELKEDPNARLFKLGFTVDEVKELINA